MLIAQMTDIHIGFAPDEKPEEYNRIRFRATLKRLLEGPNRPDMLVLSGDITDNGDLDSFAKTAELLAECPFPVWPMVGNHDTREALVEAFPQVRLDGGFVHYAVEGEGLRLLLLDTLERGRHGGAFCEARAAWLSAELDGAPETPTVIFMHHPPVVSGIEWMDPPRGEGWIQRFGGVVEGRSQILAIHCGHLHRPLATTFRGIPLHVTSSVAPLVAMDLRPIDKHVPDGRDLITTEPPAYAIHRWDGTSLVTHYEQVSDWRVLAHYTGSLQAMIQDMFAERE
ncbi:MAG TPA: metallophosphoesterase [Croceibacterium sp.]|nr:metallophosphoesterase [Croceibacterium sp.]